MELVYITHGNILNIHALSPAVSWTLVVGALYGILRLIFDVARVLKSVRLVSGEDDRKQRENF